MKKTLKPSTCLAPVPVVLVTCGNGEEKNIVTLAWVGTVNSDPPVLTACIRYNRHSYGLVEKTGEFTVNLVTKELVHATDVCGVTSGKNTDKFALTGLTAADGEKNGCPYIAESPVSLECKVIKKVELPTHAVFFGEVVNVIADEKYTDEKGRLHLPDGLLAAYSGGAYVATGETLGKYGYSAGEKKE